MRRDDEGKIMLSDADKFFIIHITIVLLAVITWLIMIYAAPLLADVMFKNMAKVEEVTVLAKEQLDGGRETTFQLVIERADGTTSQVKLTNGLKDYRLFEVGQKYIVKLLKVRCEYVKSVPST